jgi:hypothetical protein
MNPIFNAWNKGVSRSGTGDGFASFAMSVASFQAQTRNAMQTSTRHFRNWPSLK